MKWDKADLIKKIIAYPTDRLEDEEICQLYHYMKIVTDDGVPIPAGIRRLHGILAIMLYAQTPPELKAMMEILLAPPEVVLAKRPEPKILPVEYLTHAFKKKTKPKPWHTPIPTVPIINWKEEGCKHTDKQQENIPRSAWFQQSAGHNLGSEGSGWCVADYPCAELEDVVEHDWTVQSIIHAAFADFHTRGKPWRHNALKKMWHIPPPSNLETATRLY